MSEPITIKLGDREYSFGHFTQALQGKFEAYLKHQALQGVVAQKESLGSEYPDALSHHVFDCANGKFEFYGRLWWQYVLVPKHFEELLWLSLSTQGMTPKKLVGKLVAEYPQELTAVWKQLVEEDSSKKD